METFKFLTNEYLKQLAKVRTMALGALRHKLPLTVQPEDVAVVSSLHRIV